LRDGHEAIFFPFAYPSCDDGPGSVADYSDRFVGVEECFRELYGLWIHSKLVRIHDAARKRKSVEIARIGTVQR
jgi:hypothetical protein